MKMITAVVKPHQLDKIRDALSAIGVHGLTISEVKGIGKQKGHRELYRGSEYVIDYNHKIKLEVAVRAEKLDEAVQVIIESANTNQVGDGKIFIHNLEKVVRIRTGETDENAL